MRNFLLCVLSAFLFSGCLKGDSGCKVSDNPIVAPASEAQAIADYLATNGLVATKHSSNLYYEIIQPGSGGAPNVCSQVVMKYTGKLTNGTVFDTQDRIAFTLGALIEGWRKGVPLIQKGGSIKLYIPPTLGYGGVDLKDNSGNIVIPGNSILIFDITLIDF